MGSDRRDRQGAKDEEVDEAIADSFPASDPPSYSGVTGPGEPGGKPERSKPHERGEDARPTGLPNSDRHATETAEQWEDQEQPHKPARGRS